MPNLKLNSQHDIIIGRGATRVSAQTTEFVAQLVKCRLLALLGEWEPETAIGIDWFNLMESGSVAALQRLNLVVSNVISTTTGVSFLDKLDIIPDVKKRHVTIVFRATSIYNETINQEVIYGWNLS